MPARAQVRIFRPRGAAAQLFLCHAREVLIEGPVGTGKSRPALEKIHYYWSKYPLARFLLLRQTRESLTDSTLVTWEEEVLGLDHPALAGATRNNRHSYTHPRTKAEVVCGGLDNAAKYLSTQYDMIFLDEANQALRRAWDHLVTRTRNHRIPHPDSMYPDGVLPDGTPVRVALEEGYFLQWGNRCPDRSPLFLEQAIAGTNPDDEDHWLNVRAERSMVRLVTTHADNPTLTPEYLASLDNLEGYERDRLRDGKWTTATGRILDTYHHGVHLIRRREIPKCDWYCAGIDFGYRPSPGALGVVGVKGNWPNQRLYVVEEVYRLGKLDDWWAEIVVQLHAQYGFRWLVCDSAENDRIDKLNLALNAGPARNAGGIAVAANKSFQTGIQAVRYYLARDDQEWQQWLVRNKLPANFRREDLAPHLVERFGEPPPAGEVRLRIADDTLLLGHDDELARASKPYCLEHEITKYRYREEKEGKPIRIDPDPLCADHACDWLRYLCLRVQETTHREIARPKVYDPNTLGHDAGHAELDALRIKEEQRMEVAAKRAQIRARRDRLSLERRYRQDH